MSSNFALKVENIWKIYHIFNHPNEKLKQFVLAFIQRFGFLKSKQNFRKFVALNDISLKVEKGETIGIIGSNGSGKSTLLQIICGTLSQNSGNIICDGRIAALLELGSGFNPEFSGRENIYLNASVLGLAKKEIDERFDDIISFAEINDFIDQPVKTYSSGMTVRLAFAVAIHVDADILIIDEVLSVGDVYFVQKCMRFIRSFQSNGGTILFVSHDTGAVTNLCDRAVYLSKGSIKAIGKAKDVVTEYLEDSQRTLNRENLNIVSNKKTTEKKYSSSSQESQGLSLIDYRLKYLNYSNLRNDIQVFKFDSQSSGFGTGDAKVQSVRLYDPISKKEISWLVGGERLCMEIKCISNDYIEKPIIGFQIKDRLGQIIFCDNTYLSHKDQFCPVQKGQSVTAEFEFVMPIIPNGEYAVSPAIANGTQEEHIQLHWLHDALILKVHSSSIALGLMGLPMKKIKMSVN